MNQLNPLSYPEHHPTDQVDKGAFPFRAPDAIAPTPSQQMAPAGADRMKQLEQMVQEMQGRAEVVEKEAYDKAYLAGEKAGMALGQKRAEQILASLQETLSEAERSIMTIGNGFAEAALDVACHLAEVIIGSEIKTDPSKLYEIARKAAVQLPQAADLKIAVAGDDYLSFHRMLEDSEAFATLISDDSVTPGTCRVISSTQDILIDPAAAAANCLDQLMPALIAETGFDRRQTSRIDDTSGDSMEVITNNDAADTIAEVSDEPAGND